MVEKRSPGRIPKATGRRRRAPGRPVAGASPDPRDRLLDAALACYVRRGIAATSVRDIADEADVTPALVHYYHGDAAQLREAVIEQRLVPAVAVLAEGVMKADVDDPAALVGAFVNGAFAAIQRHPWLPALWVREVVSEGGALRDLLVNRFAPGVAQHIAKGFAHAQARGRLNPDLDPRVLMVSLVGLTLFPAAGAPIWRQLFDADDLDLDDLRRHALALLDRGLELDDET